MHKMDVFKDYENTKLETVNQFMNDNSANTFAYDELENHEVEGIPIALKRRSDGKLYASFIPDTHLLAIGATRSGKTTGFVLPTINLMLKKKNKPNMIISDPKQEIYGMTASKFKDADYNIYMLDFTDYMHSDCWNPLTKYFRMYQQYLKVEDEVTVVKTPKGLRHSFRGVLYDNLDELDIALNKIKNGYFSEVEKGISTLAMSIIPTLNMRDPFWEDSARNLLKAILYGMLEDSDSVVENGRITEETFSFDTVLRIFDSFTDSRSPYDAGYFSHRHKETSKAYQLADKCIVEQAEKTRNCIVSSFASKMTVFRDICVRNITCTNSFEAEDFNGDRPSVIFLSYKDEEPLHYEIISMFLSNLYTELIGISRKQHKPLERPFYFMLDEFGNLPKFNEFEKVISACGGRNIWLLLILQSYAQLYQVYGQEAAEVIKDNLNTHIFFGTNNSQTKREFSEECGSMTHLSPLSAMNGRNEAIDSFDKDTVPAVTVSRLNVISPGECYVTRMRSDPLHSYMERSYNCPEFDGEIANPDDRISSVNFVDPKYVYKMPKYENAHRSFSSFFD